MRSQFFMAIKSAIRHFQKNSVYGGLNIVGLSLAFATIILVAVYLHHETSFEDFHTNSDSIYRPTYKYQNQGDFEVHWARIPVDYINELPAEIPEIKHLIRFQNREQRYIKIGQNRFKPKHAYTTDPEVFKVFDFPLMLGESASALMQPNSVVITESVAKKYFGRTSVLGQELTVTGDFSPEESIYVITGVIKDVPTNTHLPVDMFFSFTNTEERKGWAYVYLMLDEGADIANVESKIPAFLAKYNEPESNTEVNLAFQSLKDIHLNSNLAREIQPNGQLLYVKIFFWVGFFIWLIALVNFANLGTALALRKGKEIGVRKILGAKKNQLVFFSLVESIIYSFIALFFGVLTAYFCFPAFSKLTGILVIPSLIPFALILLFVTVVSGCLAGLFPALMLGSLTIQRITNLGSRWTILPTGRRIGFRRIIMTVQFCATIILVASAFAAFRQFQYINNKNLGINAEQIIAIANVPDHVTRGYPLFKDRLQKIPGVMEVSACMQTPSQEIRDVGPVLIRGGNEDPAAAPLMDMQVIDPSFLSMMGMEFISGSDLGRNIAMKAAPPFDEEHTAKDYLASNERHYIINETAMKKLGWQDPNEAIGQEINWSIGPFELAYGPITGVVKDYHQESLRNIVDPTVMVVEPIWLRTFLIKVATNDLEKTLSSIEGIWNNQFTIALEYHFLDDLFNNLYQQDRVLLKLLSVLAILAIIISFIGLISLVAFALKTRAKEIAIRRVIGANLANLTSLIGKEYFWIIGMSTLVGIPVSIKWVTDWSANFAYQLPTTPWVYLWTIVLILTLLLVIIVLQTIMATGQHPMHALRED